MRLKIATKPVYKHTSLVQTEDGKTAKVFPVGAKYATVQIKKISTRQQKLNAAYLVLRKQFLKAHTLCQAQAEGCTGSSQDLHHMAGRGEYLLNDKYFLAVCRSCHSIIESRPAWAKEKGFSISRLSKAI